MDIKSKLLKIIPSHWKVKRIKNIGNVNGGLTYSPENVVDFDSNNSILVLRSSNIQNGKISFLDNVYVNIPVNKKQITKVGDILICSRNGSRRLLGKNALIDESSKNLAFGAFMTILRTKHNKYIKYYLSSGIFDSLLNSSTSTINQLTTKDIKNIEVPLPSAIEQERIVCFLDKKCSKIDTEISLLEKKSKLLEEYKQSLIFETVTKGLDKNAKMKDSGVDWIGEIPEHWNVKRLKKDIKYLKLPKAKLNSSHYLEIGDINIYENSYDILGKDKLSVDNARICPENVILMSTVRPNRGAITITKYKHPISNAFCPLKGHKYWFYFVKCKGFLNEIIKLNMDTTYPTCKDIHIINQAVCIPSLQEKNEIVDFLEKEIPNIDKNINLINRKIELLKEYKQSLIHEAVTGQLEI